MGIQIQVGGVTYEAVDYRVQEDATPSDASDFGGSVGTITLTIPMVDDYVDSGSELDLFGPAVLEGEEVSIFDDRRGYTLGTVRGVSHDRGSGLLTLDCYTALGNFLVYETSAEPFVGTLGSAVDYYASLAGMDAGVSVDSSIADRQVIFPGWSGDLWYNMKRMAQSQDCDIVVVSNVILVRPMRTREAVQDRDIDQSWARNPANLARAIEIYQYSYEPIQNSLVWPPVGVPYEDVVMTVPAASTVEYTLDLSSSLSDVVDPVPVWEPSGVEASEYTIMTDGGDHIRPERWTALGGRVEAIVNPDTTSLTIRITGPSNLFGSDNFRVESFSLSLGDGDDRDAISTLQLVGTGVRYNKTLRTIRTAVPDDKTETTVGVTVDNPFVSSADQAYSAGTRIARRYAGPVAALSGTVSTINRRGDNGSTAYFTYDDVQGHFSGMTYDEVRDLFAGGGAGYGVLPYGFGPYGGGAMSLTYTEVREYLRPLFVTPDVDQQFGNVAGARVWDNRTRRWYRIISGTTEPGPISYEAEDDLLIQDIMGLFSDLTYDEVDSRYEGMTYRKVDMVGMYNG